MSESPAPGADIAPGLRAALDTAREWGLIGASVPLAQHIAHARALGDTLVETLGRRPRRLLDLGSGGGIPGLVLAVDWPDVEIVLLDAQQRPTELLRAAVERMSLPNAVVVRARAEDAARDVAWRESFAGVTARSFAPPAVTAECATGFLAVGGVLVVAEPPGAPPRWDREGLAALGLHLEARTTAPVAVVALRKAAPTPADVPRGSGRPAKRPRW